jgi:predicted metal-binding protein
MNDILPAVMVCLQCGSTLRDEAGQKVPNPAAVELAEELRGALEGVPVRVQLVRCFTHCKEPIAWGLRDEGRFAYTFAPAGDVAEMVEVVKLWLAAEQGQVKRKLLPEALQGTLKSRIAPLAD